MDNYKRRFVTFAEEDRISNLPENLIVSILEQLPVQDAIRTNILSKNWRYKWTTMTKLVLDKQFSEKFAEKGAFDPNGFIRITNQVLNLHKGDILKLYLHIPNMILDSFQEVDQWILLLSRNGVRELILTNSNQRYHLPSYMFFCTELRILQLENCILKPPPEFKGFVFLEDLLLTNIDFGDRLYGTMITLPRLKNLTLQAYINFYNFYIKSPILEDLIVIEPVVTNSFLSQLPSFVYSCLKYRKLLLRTTCIFNSPLDLQGLLHLEVITLTRVEFGAAFYGKLINLPQLKSLKMIHCINVHNINIQATKLQTLVVFTDPDATLLQLSHSQCLTNVPKWLPDVVNRLRHWTFIGIKFGDLDQLQGTLWMLRNSPNLERLSVLKGLRGMNLDEQPAISYLEASDGLIQTLDRLKEVEIKSIEGSKPELLFIKLLMAHSPILEKMAIQLSGPADAHKSLNFAKEVMRFRRASTQAEMFFLDP